jgi:alanyl-tRNA synthetase
VAGVKVIEANISGADADCLKSAGDYFKSLKVPYAAFLVAKNEDKVSFLVAASQDLVGRGFHSGQIVKEVSTVVDGNGGGRPDFAIGGGKNISKASEAVELAKKIIKKAVEK